RAGADGLCRACIGSPRRSAWPAPAVMPAHHLCYRPRHRLARQLRHEGTRHLNTSALALAPGVTTGTNAALTVLSTRTTAPTLACWAAAISARIRAEAWDAVNSDARRSARLRNVRIDVTFISRPLLRVGLDYLFCIVAGRED